MVIVVSRTAVIYNFFLFLFFCNHTEPHCNLFIWNILRSRHWCYKCDQQTSGTKKIIPCHRERRLIRRTLILHVKIVHKCTCIELTLLHSWCYNPCRTMASGIIHFHSLLFNTLHFQPLLYQQSYFLEEWYYTTQIFPNTTTTTVL